MGLGDWGRGDCACLGDRKCIPFPVQWYLYINVDGILYPSIVLLRWYCNSISLQILPVQHYCFFMRYCIYPHSYIHPKFYRIYSVVRNHTNKECTMIFGYLYFAISKYCKYKRRVRQKAEKNGLGIKF